MFASKNTSSLPGVYFRILSSFYGQEKAPTLNHFKLIGAVSLAMLLYSYYFWRIWYQNCTSNILKYHLEYLHTNVILTSYHYVFERCWFSLIKSYQNHLRTRFFSAHRWVFAALEAFVPPKSKRSLKESLHRRPSIVFCWVFLFVCSFVCLFVCFRVP